MGKVSEKKVGTSKKNDRQKGDVPTFGKIGLLESPFYGHLNLKEK